MIDNQKIFTTNLSELVQRRIQILMKMFKTRQKNELKIDSKSIKFATVFQKDQICFKNA